MSPYCRECGQENGHWAGCPAAVLEQEPPERQLDNEGDEHASHEDQG